MAVLEVPELAETIAKLPTAVILLQPVQTAEATTPNAVLLLRCIVIQRACSHSHILKAGGGIT